MFALPKGMWQQFTNERWANLRPPGVKFPQDVVYTKNYHKKVSYRKQIHRQHS